MKQMIVSSSGDESVSDLSSSFDSGACEDLNREDKENNDVASRRSEEDNCDSRSIRSSSGISKRERQVIQGLDDLIAGVPAPDYETTPDDDDDDLHNSDLSNGDSRRSCVTSINLSIKNNSIAIFNGYEDEDEDNDNDNDSASENSFQIIPSSESNQLHLVRSGSTSSSTSVEYSDHKIVSRSTSEPHSNPPPAPPLPPFNGTSLEEKEQEMREKMRADRSVSLPTQNSESNEDLFSSSGKSNSKGGMPFIPPKFHAQPSGHGLIKPSEYLRSLTDPSESSSLPSIPEIKEEDNKSSIPEPPPPPTSSPSPSPTVMSNSNGSNTATNSQKSSSIHGAKTTLPSISVTDLKSVQLRKTEAKLTTRSQLPLKIHMEKDLLMQKNDVIAELKMGVDIDGIKKLKTEKLKEEISLDEKQKEELKKQYVADKFVEKIPEVDVTGNPIPQWKRQMLARKAAEKAKKEAEEKRQKELEEKRIQTIPEWKRQLMARKEEERQRCSRY
ncbi:hypothetical protein Anas_01310 [Armadillidium nasatum]|uniref:Espin n=1 Tax=Armadillidium nasatum TaxID=96803 RepID=A0A5N5TLK8_9CRUS|nr:hypothetical protein Anas_01310 [Armadillidium nasatum]